MNKSLHDKVLVLDLGNVVLPFDHRRACSKLADISGTEEDFVYERLISSGMELEFEKGKISPREFYHKTCDLLHINLSFDEFKTVWSDIFATNHEMDEIISSLNMSNYEMYLLSNTNVLHFEYVLHNYKVLNQFKDFVLSYRIGYTKPDIHIFQAIIEMTGLEASKHYYFDDIEENVLAARELGIIGFVFHSPREFISDLRSQGFDI